MFTGIVEELGRVRAVDADRRRRPPRDRRCATVLDDAEIGASIAVNGCCLTVVELDDTGWSQPTSVDRDAGPHAPSASLAPGDPVNLERPVRLADRLGGHLVQGHVDAVGTVTERRPGRADGSTRLAVHAPRRVLRYVVQKGSITVDGVSLTVADVADDQFGVALIPHTLDGHHARRAARSAPAEPRGRPDRQVRRAAPRAVAPTRPAEVAMTFDRQSRTPSTRSRRGEFVVVVDDEDRENEGDLIIAAERMTPEKMAFMIRHTSGVICLPMEGARLDELSLPAHGRPDNTEGAAHRVHRLGRRPPRHHHRHLRRRPRPPPCAPSSTPPPAPRTSPRPGHIFPLRYRDGGVLKRAGHTEAAVDLARLAGCYPAGVLAEIVNDDGTMAAPARARGVRGRARPRSSSPSPT